MSLVQFDYDNGFGSTVGRFKIDLYYANEDHGDCGDWVGSICDKPDTGCKDTSELFICIVNDMTLLPATG